MFDCEALHQELRALDSKRPAEAILNSAAGGSDEGVP